MTAQLCAPSLTNAPRPGQLTHAAPTPPCPTECWTCGNNGPAAAAGQGPFCSAHCADEHSATFRPPEAEIHGSAPAELDW